MIKIIISILIPIILFIPAILIFPGDYGLICGGLMGLSLGYIIETEKIRYEPTDLSTTQRIIFLVIGLAITLLLYFGLSAIFPEFEPAITYRIINNIMDFLQYFILSFILVTLVPWIFTKIKRN